jgi:flagellar FliL protein
MAMAESADAKPKRSKKPLLISVVLSLILGGGGYYAASQGLIPGLGEKHAEETGPKLPPMAFVSIPPVIVSLGDAGEQRHLRFVAQLEVTPAKREAVETLLPRISDVMNGYLRAVDGKTLEDRSGLVRIRAQLLRRIQLVSGEGAVRDLLITEFVLN